MNTQIVTNANIEGALDITFDLRGFTLQAIPEGGYSATLVDSEHLTGKGRLTQLGNTVTGFVGCKFGAVADTVSGVLAIGPLPLYYDGLNSGDGFIGDFFPVSAVGLSIPTPEAMINGRGQVVEAMYDGEPRSFVALLRYPLTFSTNAYDGYFSGEVDATEHYYLSCAINALSRS